MKKFVVALVAIAACAVVNVETAQQQDGRAGAPQPPAEGGRGRGRGPAPVDTLGVGPWDFPAGRGVRIHVTAIKGLDHPWGIAFVPDGSMLVTERPGRLRVIRLRQGSGGQGRRPRERQLRRALRVGQRRPAVRLAR